MKKTAYIYKITNTKTNKCYVGFTENPDIRWHEHQAAKNHETMPLHAAIKEECVVNFTFEILYQSENIKHTLFVMEPYFIGLHRSHTTLGGYNVNFGGDHPFLNRDGYAILLQSNDWSNCDSTITADVKLNEEKLDDVDYSAWTNQRKAVQVNRKIYKDSAEGDMCLRLIKRINSDGKNAVGKYYLLHGEKIECFSSRSSFIDHCNKIPGCSPLKLLQNAKSIIDRKEKLSHTLLKSYRVRGFYAVFVVEHLLFNPPNSSRRRRRNGRQTYGVGKHSFVVDSSIRKFSKQSD